jgi:hypothetical protein
VCLVLSLIIIRNDLRASGSHVGPILALSYKNHAIDEFLVDVLHNNRQLTQGKLIRLGKPENEKLLGFTERNSALETEAYHELESRLSVLKAAYNKLQQWMMARDIAVIVGDTEIAECLMVCFHYLAKSQSKRGPESDDDESEDEDDLDERNFLLLQSLLKESTNTQRIDAIIPNICRGMEHWVFETSRNIALLGQWLRGNVPPPRCNGYFEAPGHQRARCNEATPSAGVQYCSKFHSCSSQSCPQIRSPQSTKFCDHHRCQIIDSRTLCGEMRISEYLPFCINHACKVCLSHEREVGDVCRAHCCPHPGCQNPVMAELNFCDAHCCPTCLKFGTVTSSSSGDLVSRYCSALHRCQFPFCSSPMDFVNGLCQNHTCLYCEDCVCVDGVSVCLRHKCQCTLEDCYAPVAQSLNGHRLSNYCELHTCRFCAMNNMTLDREVSLTSYTCDEHVLCTHLLLDGSDCPNLASQNSSFCLEHTQQMVSSETTSEFCCGITKKGKPCRTKRPLGQPTSQLFYCHDHRDQGKNKSAKIKLVDVNINLFQPLVRVHHRSCDIKSNIRVTDFYQCCQPDCQRLELYQIDRPNSKKSKENNNNRLCRFHRQLFAVQSQANVPVVPLPQPKQVLRAIIKEEEAPVSGPHASFNESKEDEEFPLDDAIEEVSGMLAGTNVDEMEMENPDDFAVDEPEPTKHFEEIYQEETDETDNVFGAPELPVQEIDDIDLETSIENLKKCFDWNWEMSLLLRQGEVFTMVTSVCRILMNLIHFAESFVDEARQLKAEASAHILKQASVIGGTVVGAAKRLAALRAAEPFAIIVEEACEVMEPTLVAVLAVESVKKLELIGDHRQLPAFINQCWYNLEFSIPSIKTSLFERIIMSENRQGGVMIQRRDNVCSILDVQRRMRTSISNLTKGEYADLVAIEDHPATAVQKIGDKAVTKPPLRSSWEYLGRSVPGLQSCVYFWNLENNSESRPIAGLSACNENEGLAVVQLVKYLTLCGVSDECITIITPYDGQRRLIVKLLRDHHCLPHFHQLQQRTPTNRHHHHAPPQKYVEEKTIRVSTVDRYQGDENDIVILSLVRTRPGNRFVGLLNRFIVATSRARLGFYLIGSLSAVVHNNEGPKHWKRFVEHLSHPDASGCDPSYQDPRVGSELPICCPLHHQSKTTVSSLSQHRAFPNSDQWKHFCSEICVTMLDCGHPCRLPCHFPQLNEHNSHCQEAVPRPCSRHKHIPLICGTIPRSPGQSLKQALKVWKCEQLVKLQLDCEHEINLECWKGQLILSGGLTPPLCEVIEQDYIHPACGHRIEKPKCHCLQEYLISPPKCEVKVTVTRSCGHKKAMKCFQASDGSCDTVVCKEVVRNRRPRCKHQFNLRCPDYARLSKCWTDSYDEVKVNTKQVTIVEEGKMYGPSESTFLPALPSCMVEVEYRKPCGHLLTLGCQEAFDLSKTKSKSCQEAVEVKCLLCDGLIHIPCHLVDEYNELCSLGLYEGVVLRDDSSVIAHEGRFPSGGAEYQMEFRNLFHCLKSAKCKSMINLQRNCHRNHVSPFSCSDLLMMFVLHEKEMPICQLPYPLPLECGHSVDVKCSKRSKPPPLCRRPNMEEFKYPDCQHASQPKTCGELKRLKASSNAKCPLEVSHSLSRCHHPVTVKCSDLSLIKDNEASGYGICLPSNSNVVLASEVYCQPCSLTPICRSLVSFEFECGHQIADVQCCDAFAWSDDISLAPICSTPVSFPNPLCFHDLSVPCNATATLENWEPWIEGTPPDSVSITLGTEAEPVEAITYPLSYIPAFDDKISKLGIKCQSRACILFDECGHSRTVACHEVYSSHSQLTCQEVVDINCEKCSSLRHISCHTLNHLSSVEITMQCNNLCEKKCQVCGLTTRAVPCNQIEVTCQRVVKSTLPCGHEGQWKCGKDEDPRHSYDTERGVCSLCIVCSQSKWKLDNELELDANVLVKVCRDVFHEVAEVGTVFSVLEERVLVDLSEESGAITAHETTRHRLISKLQEAIRSKDSQILFPAHYSSPEEYIKQNYRLVYLPIPLANEPTANQLKSRCQLEHTPYGKGKLISVFQKHSLSKVVSMVNGQAKVCLALAFQSKPLSNTPPFIVGKGSNELTKKANVTMMGYQKKGFDCVEVVRERERDKESPIEMIYWSDGMIVPLLALKLQFHTSCLICGDYFSRCGGSGILCSNSTTPHFVCHSDFSDYLEAAQKPDALNSYINTQGEVTCPGCRSGYDVYQLAATGDCPPVIFETLQKIKLEWELKKNEALVRREAEEEMKRELERIQRLSEEDREIHIRRQRIISEILTPKCPRCRSAFIDFSGCFALTCRNNQCRCGFCAWCFEDCGGYDEAHSHVPNCRWGVVDGVRLGVYGDKRKLQQVWNQIRKRKIDEELSSCSRNIRKKILDSLAKDFQDIKLVWEGP